MFAWVLPRTLGEFDVLKEPPTPTVEVVVGGAANCKGALPLVGVDALIIEKNWVLLVDCRAANKREKNKIDE